MFQKRKFDAEKLAIELAEKHCGSHWTDRESLGRWILQLFREQEGVIRFNLQSEYDAKLIELVKKERAK